MSALLTTPVNAGLRKLAGRFANRSMRAAAAAVRFYNYAVNDGTLEAEYLLRDSEGTYREVWSGTEPLHGVLAHISDDPVVVQGQTFNGHRYKGTDEAGEWLYFFGSDDMTGAGEFIVGIFFSDFTEDTIIYATLASRSDA